MVKWKSKIKVKQNCYMVKYGKEVSAAKIWLVGPADLELESTNASEFPPVRLFIRGIGWSSLRDHRRMPVLLETTFGMDNKVR